jgi:hypothetical protein
VSNQQGPSGPIYSIPPNPGSGVFPSTTLTGTPAVDNFCADQWLNIGETPAYSTSMLLNTSTNTTTMWDPPSLVATLAANGKLYSLSPDPNGIENVAVWSIDTTTGEADPFITYGTVGVTPTYAPVALAADTDGFYLATEDATTGVINVSRYNNSGVYQNLMATVAVQWDTTTEVYISNVSLVALSDGLLLIAHVSNPADQYTNANLYWVKDNYSSLSTVVSMGQQTFLDFQPTVFKAQQTTDGTLWLACYSYFDGLECFSGDFTMDERYELLGNLIALAPIANHNEDRTMTSFPVVVGAFPTPGLFTGKYSQEYIADIAANGTGLYVVSHSSVNGPAS